MERYLYTRLIDTALESLKDKSSLPDEVINRLRLVNSLSQGVVNTVVDLSSLPPVNALSSSVLTPSRYSVVNGDMVAPEPLAPEGVLSIQELFDESFLIQHSGGLTHYSKDLKVIQVFPFEYTSPTLASEYMPSGLVEVLNLDSSLIFIPNTDIVQVYSYDGASFSHLGLIGSLTSTGVSSGLLLDVKCVSSYLLDTGDIRLFISGGEDENSYVKEVLIQSDASVISEEVILSYSSDNQGFMTKKGVYNITALASDANTLFLASLDVKQLGAFNLTSSTFDIVFEDALKYIGSNDYLSTPASICFYSDSLVCADTRGHIYIINPDFTIGAHHGQPRETLHNTTYSFSFPDFSSVSVSGSKILAVAQGEIFTSNLLGYQDSQTLSVQVISPPIDSRLSGVHGLGAVSVGIGSNNTIHPVCETSGIILPPSTTLTIQFSRTSPLDSSSRGLVVFELC